MDNNRPFQIDSEYTLVYNTKNKIDSIFIGDIKFKKVIPKFLKNDENLYLYCLIKNGLTQEEPDNNIYTYFIRYMYFIEEKIPIDKMLKYVKDTEDKIRFINFYYNIITK